jgi:Zn-dependent protease
MWTVNVAGQNPFDISVRSFLLVGYLGLLAAAPLQSLRSSPCTGNLAESTGSRLGRTMLKSVDPFHVVVTYLGLLVALTMHEAALAFAARRMGHRSLDTASRATINPLPHADVFGTLIFPLLMLFSGSSFLFGWAKPMIFDTRYFRKVRRDINVISLVGMASNFSIAICCGIAIRVLGYSQGQMTTGDDPVARLLYSVAMGNVFIGMFNVLPFPGRDMWRIIINNAPYELSQKLEASANIVSIVLLLLIIIGVFSPFFSVAIGLFHFAFVA